MTKAIRTISLTPKGKRAIADMPKLTWDEVQRRGRELAEANQAASTPE